MSFSGSLQTSFSTNISASSFSITMDWRVFATQRLCCGSQPSSVATETAQRTVHCRTVPYYTVHFSSRTGGNVRSLPNHTEVLMYVYGGCTVRSLLVPYR